MKHAALLLCLATPLFAETWPLDHRADTWIVRGTATSAAGAFGQSLVLDGDSLIEIKDSANLGGGAFTVSLWFNPYDLAGGQQMLVGKNRYSLNQRQWSLTIEPDGRLKAHLKQGGSSTISCAEPLKAGAWHWVALVVDSDKATLFLNGKPAGEVGLKTPVASTEAPITLGGIWDADQARQTFNGALDELTLEPRARTAAEIAAGYRPVSARHDVTKVVGLLRSVRAQFFPCVGEASLSLRSARRAAKDSPANGTSAAITELMSGS